MKNIEIKVYNLDGTFQETLKSNDNLSDFSYSWAINEWQGECEIELNRAFSDTSIIHGDVIRVYLFDDFNYVAWWQLIYTWVVNRITRKFTRGIETVSISALWLWMLLVQVYFYSWGYTFSVNQDPAITIKAIIDYFNTKYTGNWLSYSEGLVETYGSNINISFDYTKCFTAIKNLVETTQWYWIIKPNWQVQFTQKPVAITHKFTINKDIEEITVSEDGEKIVNKYFLAWNSGTNSGTDATSESTYGLRELKAENAWIWNSGSADIAIASYIAKNKDPKKKTSLIVNKNYDFNGTIDTIKPWDTVKVLNFNYTIDNLQIAKIDYTFDKVKIELEEFETIAKEIFL